MEVVVSEAEETKVVLWTEEAAADIQAATQELAEATRDRDIVKDVANGTDALIALPDGRDLGDLQSSLTRLVLGVVLTNLRLTQELVSISSPSAFAALQHRFAL